MNNFRVVFLSDWFGSPYKQLLADHLEPQEVYVEEYQQHRTFLPQVIEKGIPKILHLHSTLHNYLWEKTSSPLRWIRLCQFIAQIILLRLLGTKTVWTVHEWADKHNRGNRDIPSSYYALMGKFLHAIITHCDSVKREIVEAFHLQKNNKVFVVPHGNYIDVYENQVSQQEARDRLNIPAEDLVFLFFGNIYKYKGILEAIDAFKCLESDRLSFIIAGRLPQGQPELEEQILDKIEDQKNIIFVPKKIPDQDVQLYMNACDCVLTPYQTFTTSGVTLLSMSFGRACIAPSVGFFKDVLDESGSFLYDLNHEEGLLKAMQSAIAKREELPAMGKHNLQLAQQCNWDYVAAETLNIYQGN